MNKMYRVLFIVKKGGERGYVFDVEARNATAAKEQVKSYWEQHRATAHLFRLRAKCVEYGEHHMPRELSHQEYNAIYTELFES